jgi:hypothetical protein
MFFSLKLQKFTPKNPSYNQPFNSNSLNTLRNSKNYTPNQKHLQTANKKAIIENHTQKALFENHP